MLELRSQSLRKLNACRVLCPSTSQGIKDQIHKIQKEKMYLLPHSRFKRHWRGKDQIGLDHQGERGTSVNDHQGLYGISSIIKYEFGVKGCLRSDIIERAKKDWF